MTPRDIACIELVELLTDYLEGALPADEVAAVDAHLETCSACRTYLARYRSRRFPPRPTTRCSRRSGTSSSDAWRPSVGERPMSHHRRSRSAAESGEPVPRQRPSQMITHHEYGEEDGHDRICANQR